MQNYLNNYYITEKPTRKDILQLSVTVVTKNTRRQKTTRRKPRRLVVTTAITTRKR